MANCCEYYPCHSGLFQGFSCEFCHCPEYYTKCSGTPKWVGDRKEIKDCSECLIPHNSEYVRNYYKEKKDGKDDNREVLS
jgi:Zn-finger protein